MFSLLWGSSGAVQEVRGSVCGGEGRLRGSVVVGGGGGVQGSVGVGGPGGGGRGGVKTLHKECIGRGIGDIRHLHPYTRHNISHTRIVSLLRGSMLPCTGQHRHTDKHTRCIAESTGVVANGSETKQHDTWARMFALLCAAGQHRMYAAGFGSVCFLL